VGTLGHAARKIIVLWSAKAAESARVKYWEIIANRLSKAGWSWGCVSAIDAHGRTIWIVDAHRVTMSPGISQTKCRSGCLTDSILSFNSNPNQES
jgi:hypothetical protein